MADSWRGPYRPAPHIASIPTPARSAELGTLTPLHHSYDILLPPHSVIVHPQSWARVRCAMQGACRGACRLFSSDTLPSWKGSTANAEDPFLWVDRRHNWHVLYEGYPMPGAHAFSEDGITWSNISTCFNLSRPFIDEAGRARSVSYYSARPKLLFAADGVTPTHLYGSTTAENNPASFTIASPLRATP